MLGLLGKGRGQSIEGCTGWGCAGFVQWLSVCAFPVPGGSGAQRVLSDNTGLASLW